MAKPKSTKTSAISGKSEKLLQDSLDWSPFPLWELIKFSDQVFGLKVSQTAEQPVVAHNFKEGPVSVKVYHNHSGKLVGYTFTTEAVTTPSGEVLPKVTRLNFSVAVSYLPQETVADASSLLTMVFHDSNIRVLKSGSGEFFFLIRFKSGSGVANELQS